MADRVVSFARRPDGPVALCQAGPLASAADRWLPITEAMYARPTEAVPEWLHWLAFDAAPVTDDLLP